MMPGRPGEASSITPPIFGANWYATPGTGVRRDPRAGDRGWIQESSANRRPTFISPLVVTPAIAESSTRRESYAQAALAGRRRGGNRAPTDSIRYRKDRCDAGVTRDACGRAVRAGVGAGAEDDVNGFNSQLSCCNQVWASWMGGEETTYGPYIQNNKGVWIPTGVTTSAIVNLKSVTYTISPKAYWYWGGRKVPVTYQDFVYTLQQVDNPNNDLVERTGYSNLDPTHFTHKGAKQVTFFWKTTKCSADFPCGPFANWQYLFNELYPSAALKGLDFNKI